MRGLGHTGPLGASPGHPETQDGQAEAFVKAQAWLGPAVFALRRLLNKYISGDAGDHFGEGSNYPKESGQDAFVFKTSPPFVF